jgi:hypothetical protein
MPSGYWSGYFDGTGDYLTAPANAAFQFGTGNFTIEFWYYPTAFVDFNTPIDMGYLNSGSYVIQNGTAGQPYFFLGPSTTLFTSATAYTLNAWNHLAVVRSGTNTSMYLNGARVGNATSSANINANFTLGIGGSPTHSVPVVVVGYLSNVRLVKGTAVYDPALTTLTVPTAPLTAITNTSLLCLQDNRFIDNSTNAFAITRNGDTRISKFAPFNPPASYSTASYGGSGYFDGNGDNLSIASVTALNLSSGDFTIEAWVFWSGSNANSTIINKDGLVASSYPSYDISLNGSGFIICYIGSGNGTSSIQSITSNTLLPTNTWAHLAFVKNGTTLTLYQNGVSVASATQTATITDGGKALLIGYHAGQATGYYFNGYISNARVVKGTAVYTAAFTPPTTPLTAITNTSLLLNFTNAGIFDAATINNGQTVADAQVSTTQAKWGTTSMYFDGTDDRLVFASRPEIAFGTGNFTVEGWVYRADTNTRGVFQISGTAGGLQANTSTNVALGSDVGQVWRIYANNSAYNSAATWSINTWYHFALVRNSGTTTLYIDGTSVISQADTTNYTGTNICVSGFFSTAFLMNGYIQDLRITNGYARYTANFTAPTAAFPTL